MSPLFIFRICPTEYDNIFESYIIRLAYSIDNMQYANLKGRQIMAKKYEIIEQLTGKWMVREMNMNKHILIKMILDQ